MVAKVISIAGNRPNKTTHSVVDTIEFTEKQAKAWEAPPCQRPIRINEKVRALAERIKRDGGVVPGHLTFGVVNHITYLVDGQHRREAWYLSGCETGYADITTYQFENLADLGRKFVELQSAIVTMQPDDILRGMEGCTPAIAKIKRECPFVGYWQIRRGGSSPMLSMSSLLRAWFGSATLVPVGRGISAMGMAEAISDDDAVDLIKLANACFMAWGRDLEYQRLWNGLNITMVTWLYRHCVLAQYSANVPKISLDMFGKCLMAVSASSTYLDWLHGRQLNDRDRSPCYNRLKAIFGARVLDETGHRPRLPAPPWAPQGGRIY